MVTTPWFDHEIPMTQAAELGTKKVMQEHASIGLVVTTDGTITDIPRMDYEEAERKAIMDMKATGKPFLVIINSAKPNGAEAKKVQEHIHSTYQLDALIADCQSLDTQEITQLLTNLLYTFPMTSLHVRFPRWLDALENEHPLKSTLYQSLLETAESISSLSSSMQALEQIRLDENVSDAAITQIDLGSGIVHCELRFPEELFYEVLSQKSGFAISDEADLLEQLVQQAVVLQNGHPGVGAQQEVDPHGQHDQHHGQTLESGTLLGHHVGHGIADQKANNGGNKGQVKRTAKYHGVSAHLSKVFQSGSARSGGKCVDHHHDNGGNYEQGHPDHIGDGQPGELIPHPRSPPHPDRCWHRRFPHTPRSRRNSRQTYRNTHSSS